MKKVKSIPPADVRITRDPWLDMILDGDLREIGPEDWAAVQPDGQPRYKGTRSASSAIHQAARKRGFSATVAIRGDLLFVQANVTPAKANGTKAVARKAPARKAATATEAKPRPPRKRAAKA